MIKCPECGYNFVHCSVCQYVFRKGDQHYNLPKHRVCCKSCYESQCCDVCGSQKDGLLVHPDPKNTIAVCRLCYKLAEETIAEKATKDRVQC